MPSERKTTTLGNRFDLMPKIEHALGNEGSHETEKKRHWRQLGAFCCWFFVFFSVNMDGGH